MKRSILTLAVLIIALATSHADTLSYLRFEGGSGDNVRYFSHFQKRQFSD